jgi:hypothetical protein
LDAHHDSPNGYKEDDPLHGGEGGEFLEVDRASQDGKGDEEALEYWYDVERVEVLQALS